VPTLAESGVSGVNVPSWYTLVVPARAPRAVVEPLRAALKRIASSADFSEQLARQAFDVRTLAPGEFSSFLRTEIEKWGKVVRTVGIKPD
jgi:tripartite-type tricarboxylate transporter receptor subunit TctC